VKASVAVRQCGGMTVNTSEPKWKQMNTNKKSTLLNISYTLSVELLISVVKYPNSEIKNQKLKIKNPL
jgi:hypothetical protein